MPGWRRNCISLFYISAVLFSFFVISRLPKNMGSLSEKSSEISDKEYKGLNDYKFTCKHCKYGNTPLDASRSPVPLRGDELFIFKASYDWRDVKGPRIRLLAICNCYDFKNNLTKASDIQIKVGKEFLKVGWLSMGKCPEYACYHATIDIATEPFTFEPSEMITVHIKNRSVKMKLYHVPKKYEPGITSCLEPFYWFTDWPRLIVFLEIYQKMGYSKFLITYTSVSKSSMRVLHYYVSKGLVELRPYPLLPYTDELDPNNSTYHMGEHLVEQHCALWSKTKYSSNNDIDDFFYHRNQKLSLYDWMEDMVNNHSNIGSFAIKHFGLQWNPSLVRRPFNFDEFIKLNGLKNATPFNNNRANKALFLTEFAREPFTHWVKRFFHEKHYYGAKPHEIVYLHARNSFEGQPLNNEQLHGMQEMIPEVKLIGDDPDIVIEKIRNVIKEIFGENPPPFSHETTDALNVCTRNWLKTHNGCRKPVTGCFNVVKHLEEWVFAEPNDDQQWTVL